MKGIKIDWIKFEQQLMSLDSNNNMFLFDGVQTIIAKYTNFSYWVDRGFTMSSASASHYQEIAKNKGIVEAWKTMKYDFSLDY